MMEIEKVAHDWCVVKSGVRRFEVGLPDSAVFPEEHRAEIKKITGLTLEQFLSVYIERDGK